MVPRALREGNLAVTLSVCVPTYNRAEWLGAALRTLLTQTLRDFELLVVDNGSTDSTADVVQAFGDRRIRYHRNAENLGSRANWNRCLDLASGTYVAICHDDDLYEPQFLERSVGVLDRHPRVAFVHSAVRMVDAAGRPLRLFRAHPDDRVFPGRQAYMRYLTESHDVVMSTVVARRACYDAVPRFRPELLCADFEMWLRLALQGDVAYIATALVSYRIHTGSTSLSMDPGRWYRENETIVRRAVAEGGDTIPGLRGREQEILTATRRVWARRTLKDGLLAASLGNLEAAREYLRVSRGLAGPGPDGWLRWLAGGLLTPFGARVLRGVRHARRHLRYAE